MVSLIGRGYFMKFLHLSDLHLGKRVNEVSMLDDQDYILHQILEITDVESPDAVVIAGDIYDKSVPSGEAVTLFDWFLVALAKRRVPVLLISGNHDSPERLSFGSRLLDASGIHISPVYSGEVRPITLQDEHGPVHFWLLPFLKPAHVKRFFPDEPIESYTDACRAAITQMNVDFSARNVLVTHQFVTGASTCESEELSAGGTDNVDASVFDGFDYVALGHSHKPHTVCRDKIAYSGSLEPLDRNDLGKHGYIQGEYENGNVKVRLVPCANRSYQNLVLNVDSDTTQYKLEEMLRSEVMRRGGRNIYRLILKGRVSPDNVLLTERLHGLGNIVEIMDESRPAYKIEELYRQYRGTLIGDYINKFLNKDLTVVEKKALYYGLQALLSTQVLADDRKRL